MRRTLQAIMWRRALAPSIRFSSIAAPKSASTSTKSSAAAVDSLILRSLKDHYFELSKMSPPPKVNPPAPFTVIKDALEEDGPVLRREYKDEQISISVMRLANIIPDDAENEEDGHDAINQLFLNVSISKGGRNEELNILCGLYPDAIGIHSICLVPKGGLSKSVTKYQGRDFQAGLVGKLAKPLLWAAQKVGHHIGISVSRIEEEKHAARFPEHASSPAPSLHEIPRRSAPILLQIPNRELELSRELDQKLRDGFYMFIETRGVNDKLFPFLQAWLYVKDHRNLMHWFKRVGSFINKQKTT